MKKRSHTARRADSSAENAQPGALATGTADIEGSVHRVELELQGERKQPEEARHESDVLPWSFLDQAPDAVFLYDVGTERIVDMNRLAWESLGYAREELIGKTPRDFDPNVMEDEAFLLRINERCRAGEIFSFETRHRRKDGSVFPVEIRVRPFRRGNRLLVVVLARDVSERRQAEETLRESEERFRKLADMAPVMIWMSGTDKLYSYVNQQWLNLTGRRLEEELGDGWLGAVHEHDVAGVAETHEAAFERRDEFRIEYRLRRCDGGFRWVEHQGVPRFAPGGEFLGYIGTCLDITDRKRSTQRLLAEYAVAEMLAEAESLDEAALKVIEVICKTLEWDLGTLWCMDAEGRSLRCAQLWHRPSLDVAAFEAETRATKFAPGVGLPGLVWASRFPVCFPDVAHEPRFLRASVAAGVGLHAAFAFPILLGDKVLGVIEFLSREVRPAEPAILELMAAIGSQVGQFIERKRAETALELATEELARVTRLTTLGELTASIAHEVNQPLGAMVTSAAACKRWLEATPPRMDKAQRALERIVNDGKRAGEVIGRIRSMMKRQAPRKDWLDMNELIRDVVALTRDQAHRSAVDLHVSLAEPLPRVWGDRIVLQQVLLNLIVNAIEAMGDVDDHRRELSVVSLTDGAGKALQVEVRDSGKGIDPRHAEHLFDAFYTTKAEGTGLGLSISRSIIESHGGQLSAGANEPYGAVFRFSLPLEDSPP